MGVPITNKTRRRCAVLALCLVLLDRGDCFHISSSQCSPAHVHAPLASRSTWRASSGSRPRPEPRHALLQEGAEGAEGGVPGLLRDVVIEKIEELGGGKVQQVKSTSRWSFRVWSGILFFVVQCIPRCTRSGAASSRLLCSSILPIHAAAVSLHTCVRMMLKSVGIVWGRDGSVLFYWRIVPKHVKSNNLLLLHPAIKYLPGTHERQQAVGTFQYSLSR